jgi:xylulokinase
MNYYIGGDLGTSSIKLLLLDEKGKIVRSVTEDYPLSFPHPGWSEQNPEDWWKAFIKAFDKLVKPEERKSVKGLALDGQMHGLVALDKDGKVLRPAILWNDERTIEEVEYLNKAVGKDVIHKETGNIAYAGFTAPKILWMKKNEPELFAAVKHVMLPKDYLVYRLTGQFSTDYSDAAGTLLLNVEKKKWSEKMLSLCGLEKAMLPPLHETGDIVGCIKSDVLKELPGLTDKVFVCAGAADNAAAALGVGASQDGECNISLGTSGTIFIDSDKFLSDPNGAIHAFNTGNRSYCLLACMLSAASSLKWLNESILETKDYEKEQKAIDEKKLGNNTVFFLPYLMGERSPINDPEAKGLFIGLNLGTSRSDLTLAVLEGVAFALKDSLLAAKRIGIEVKESYLTGGGSKSPLWRAILSDILGIRLKVIEDAYGPAFGMGLVALTAGGAFKNLEEAEKELIKIKDVVEPNPEKEKLYEIKYQEFKQIYPTVKELSHNLK